MSSTGVIPVPEERYPRCRPGGTPYVRHVGEVADLNDVRVPVGVDYDAVTIGRYTFTRAQMEDLAHHLIAASWEAGENARLMAEETAIPLREGP